MYDIWHIYIYKYIHKLYIYIWYLSNYYIYNIYIVCTYYKHLMVHYQWPSTITTRCRPSEKATSPAVLKGRRLRPQVVDLASVDWHRWKQPAFRWNVTEHQGKTIGKHMKKRPIIMFIGFYMLIYLEMGNFPQWCWIPVTCQLDLES